MKEFIKKHRLKLTVCAAAAVLIIAVVIFFIARGCSGAAYKVLLDWDFGKGMGDFPEKDITLMRAFTRS